MWSCIYQSPKYLYSSTIVKIPSLFNTTASQLSFTRTEIPSIIWTTYYSPHLMTLGVEVEGWRWEVAFSVGPELQPKSFPKKPSLFSWCLQGLQNSQDPYFTLFIRIEYWCLIPASSGCIETSGGVTVLLCLEWLHTAYKYQPTWSSVSTSIILLYFYVFFALRAWNK